MTACPIRYQRQVSDRKGKIFYTSITSLSHISKESGYEAAHGWRWCRSDRHYPDPPAERSVRLKTAGGRCRPYILLQPAVANGFCTCGADFQAIYSIKRRCFYEFSDKPHLCSQPAQDPHQPFLLRWWL